MISNTNLVCCLLFAVCGIVVPITMVLIWKLKTKQPLKPVLVGAVIFFVFAIILESIPKMILLTPTNPIGKYVVSHVVLLSVIAALLAGIFEETGRLVAFKFFLKKEKDRRTAITYGMGHGGFEVMYLLTASGISYFMYALMIKNGQFDQIIAQVAASSPQQAEALQTLPDTIGAITYSNVLVSLFERTSAVMIHIACSIIMFYAVNQKGKMWCFPVAILIHGSIDLFAAFYQVGMITNIYVLEAMIFVWAVLLLVGSMKLVYKKMPVTYEVKAEKQV